MIMKRNLLCVLVGLAGCTDASASEDDPTAHPGDAAKVAAGKKLYAQHCASCHDVNLED
jgi:mono/diheme cytochrome c family protein